MTNSAAPTPWDALPPHLLDYTKDEVHKMWLRGDSDVTAAAVDVASAELSDTHATSLPPHHVKFLAMVYHFCVSPRMEISLRCRHCRQSARHHADDGKCLYATTYFEETIDWADAYRRARSPP